MSAGDEVQLKYENCLDDTFEDRVNGSVLIEFENFTALKEGITAIGSLSYGAGITVIDDDDNSIIVMGEHRFDYQYTQEFIYESRVNAVERLTVMAMSEEYYSFSLNGIAERFKEFSVEKLSEHQLNARSSSVISFDIFFDSGLLGHTFTCNTDLFVQLNNTEYITCFGADSNAIRLNGAGAPIQIDSQGDGEFVDTELGLLSYTGVVEGFLFSGLSQNLQGFSEELDAGRVSLATNDIVYDNLRHRLLMTSVDLNRLNSIVSLDLETLELETLVEFDEAPNLIRFSNDYQSYYVTFEESNKVYKYNSEDSVLKFEVFVEGDWITDLKVSPADPDQFAVAFILGSQLFHSGEGDIQIFDKSAALGQTYRSESDLTYGLSVDSLNYSADGKSIYANHSRHYYQSRLILSPSGVASVEQGIKLGVSGHIKREGSLLYNRRIVNEPSWDRIGEYNGFFAYNRQVEINENENRIFALDDEVLRVYRLDTKATIASYAINLSGPKQLIDNDDFLIVRDEFAIRFFEKQAIEENIHTDCLPVEFINLDNKPFRQLKCSVNMAVYDELHNKIYASLGDGIGDKGNSVGVFDGTSLMLERLIPLWSEPEQLALSNDKNYLYAVLPSSDHIARINLSSADTEVERILMREMNGGQNFSPTNVYSSPVEDDGVIFSFSAYGSCSTSRFRSMLNGDGLSDIVFINQVSDGLFSSCPRLIAVGFDESGFFYAYDKSTDEIVEFGLNGNGVFAVSQIEMDGSFYLSTDFIVSGGVLLDVTGKQFDLLTQNDIRLFSLPRSDTDHFVFYSRPFVSADRSDIYYMSDESNLIRYDFQSQEELGRFNIAGYYTDFHNVNMLELPSDLVIINKEARSLFTINKSEI